MSRQALPPAVQLDQPPQPRIFAQASSAEGVGMQLRSDPSGVLHVPELNSVLIAVHIGPAARISCRRAGASHTGSAVHGDIDIVPAGTPARWEMHDNNDTSLLMSLPLPMMDAIAEECGFNPQRVEIKNRFQIRDTQLENIGWAIKSEMELGSPSGRLYMDSLAVSAASRLVSAHSSVAPRTERRGGLDGRRLKQTLEYIEEHLASDTNDLSLAQIAAITGLSASHFRTLFRDSVGMAVHQYVIQRRIERAKSLLMQRRHTIAEIALATGFTHQSHLSRHLQRASGLSPAQMRRILVEHSTPHLNQ
jgi:AraC family transcriptional regulator